MGTLNNPAVRRAMIKYVLTKDLHIMELITGEVHCLNGYQKDQKEMPCKRIPFWSFVNKRLLV
jgi:hypothetical protein